MNISLRLLSLLMLPALALAQTRYVITNLGNNGGPNLYPYAINASGAIVGSERVGTQLATQPFLYSGGVMTRLPSLGGNSDLSDAKGINAAGTVVGHSFVLSANAYRGWSISGGVLTDLGTGLRVNAINDAGIMVGSSGERAFLFSGATRTALGSLGGNDSEAFAINAAGVIVGTSATGPVNVTHAFRYANGAMTDLGTLGTGTASYAYGINAAGTAVGAASVIANNFTLHAVIFSGGNVIDLDPPGTTSSVFGSAAYGINSAGTVVGTYSANRAFVYTSAGGLVDLNTAVTNLAASGFGQLREAYAINDAGQIVGRGNFGSGFAAFRLDPSAAPAITAHPQPQTVAPGSSVVFSVTATGAALQYEWRLNNAAIGGATNATYTIPSAALANAGTYTVRVSSGSESVTSNPAALTVTPGVAGRLINLSILTSLAGSTDSFTMGYVVGGAGTSGTKPLVIRAAGPSLTPLGVGGALSDPQLTLFAGATQNGANDNWGGGATLQAAMTAVGAFAFAGPTSLDAAVAANVAAGDNSVKVSPVGNLSGAVIAEIYDASPAASFSATTPRLINVSVLKNIGTSLTAGFVVGGNASRTVLIRAIGPTLAGFGVGGTVADPQLALFNAASVKIAENDNWGGSAALTAVFDSVGAFRLAPATSLDAALVATLAPGNYTVQVSGVGGTTGTALVEVYEVP